MMTFTDTDRADRVFRKVTYAGGCWIFTGAVDPQGYGRIGHKDGTGLAHRAVYIALIGDPGVDVVLDHLCRNPACVNPWHLSPTTIADNVARGANKRDHPTCKQGHEYAPPNTLQRKDKRVCRKCNQAWQADYKSRMKAGT